MNYYEHHLGDYMRDTAHLSMLEDAAYRRLLDAYYVREKPLPADLRECYKLARAQSKQEREAVAYVLREFFTLGDDGHHQSRADDEIARFRAKSEKARASINARWDRTRAEQQANNERNTNVSNSGYERTTDDIHRAPVPSPQTPDTRHQENQYPPKPPKGAVHEFPPGFDRVWSVYPRKVGKDAASRAFAKRKPDAALVEAMVKAIELQRKSRDWTKDGGQFIPHLSTWLNEGRWMDEIAPAGAPGGRKADALMAGNIAAGQRFLEGV